LVSLLFSHVLFVLLRHLVRSEIIVVLLFKVGRLYSVRRLIVGAEFLPHAPDFSQNFSVFHVRIILDDLRPDLIHVHHVRAERTLGSIWILLEWLFRSFFFVFLQFLLELLVLGTIFIFRLFLVVRRLKSVRLADIVCLVLFVNILPHLAKLLGYLRNRVIRIFGRHLPTIVCRPQHVGRQRAFGGIRILKSLHHFICRWVRS